jgi:hypothetical protein
VTKSIIFVDTASNTSVARMVSFTLKPKDCEHGGLRRIEQRQE